MRFMCGILTVIVTVSMLWTGTPVRAAGVGAEWNPQNIEGWIVTNILDQIWLKTDISLRRPQRVILVKPICDDNGLFGSRRCWNVYLAENKEYRCKVLLREHAFGFDHAKCVKKKSL